ncbi:MAG: S1C family serine protease, partial [Planctomycetota bacterium]
QGKRHVARLVATDRTRMVTLLKIEAAGLPVPAAVPRAEMRVGQSALAVGRTLSPGLESLPSVSLGIVSALDRVWGKALQTDAKVSPVNYGGPLVDLEGRVLGILVPASPQGEGETAGFEWYDSGIGFAVYFDDVMAAVDRLKGGRDLEKGVLGITLAPGDQHVGPVKVATVAPGGAADKAGIKAGDLITAIHGKAVDTPARMLHALGRLYQGDKIPVSVRREMADLQLPAVELGGPAAATAPPWLGILPSRDDPEQGVLVRAVSAGGPAERPASRPAIALSASAAAVRRPCPCKTATASPSSSRAKWPGLRSA